MRINIEWKFHITNITNARFLQQRHLQPCSRRGEQLRDPMHLITARAPQQLRPWPPSIHCLHWPWHLSLSLFKPKPPVWTAKTTTPLLLLEISRKGVEEGGWEWGREARFFWTCGLEAGHRLAKAEKKVQAKIKLHLSNNTALVCLEQGVLRIEF